MYKPVFLPEPIRARLLTNAEMKKRKGQFKEALPTAEPPPAAYTLET